MPGTEILGRSTARKYTDFMKYGVYTVADLPVDVTNTADTKVSDQFYSPYNMVNLAMSVSGYDQNKIILFWHNESYTDTDTSIPTSNTADIALYMCVPVYMKNSDAGDADNEDVRYNKWVKVGDKITVNENTVCVIDNLYGALYKVVVGNVVSGDSVAPTSIRVHVSVFSETIPITQSTASTVHYSDPLFILPSPVDNSSDSTADETEEEPTEEPIETETEETEPVEDTKTEG